MDTDQPGLLTRRSRDKDLPNSAISSTVPEQNIGEPTMSVEKRAAEALVSGRLIDAKTVSMIIVFCACSFLSVIFLLIIFGDIISKKDEVINTEHIDFKKYCGSTTEGIRKNLDQCQSDLSRLSEAQSKAQRDFQTQAEGHCKRIAAEKSELVTQLRRAESELKSMYSWRFWFFFLLFGLIVVIFIASKK